MQAQTSFEIRQEAIGYLVTELKNQEAQAIQKADWLERVLRWIMG